MPSFCLKGDRSPKNTSSSRKDAAESSKLIQSANQVDTKQDAVQHSSEHFCFLLDVFAAYRCLWVHLHSFRQLRSGDHQGITTSICTDSWAYDPSCGVHIINGCTSQLECFPWHSIQTTKTCHLIPSLPGDTNISANLPTAGRILSVCQGAFHGLRSGRETVRNIRSNHRLFIGFPFRHVL